MANPFKPIQEAKKDQRLIRVLYPHKIGGFAPLKISRIFLTVKNLFGKKYFNGRKSEHQEFLTGFTLIELLVVIAILGVMMSLVLLSWREVQMRTRDTRRVSDVQTLQKALAMYQVQHTSYPPAADETKIDGADAMSQTLRGENLLNSSVKDPINAVSDGVNYIYTYQSADGVSYLIKYCLETDSIQGKSKGCGNEATP
jgi:prepilin-type N-terminal cleavage/methylation domain-containing protein